MRFLLATSALSKSLILPAAAFLVFANGDNPDFSLC